jgi:hypothetical protein
MSKLNLGIRLVCASILSFMGGAFMMSKRQGDEKRKIKNELGKMIRELKETKNLLASKDLEILAEIEKALENEREKRVSDRIKAQQVIKLLESKLDMDDKKDDTAS